MTDKISSICLKINIHIQTLIVLQTQKFYHGKRQKYMMCMSTILYIENFLKIKENQDHNLKKISENYIYFFEEELESNSNLKNNAMVKLLKDKFGIEVSESIIRRSLQEHEFHYIGPKICQKILGKINKKE